MNSIAPGVFSPPLWLDPSEMMPSLKADPVLRSTGALPPMKIRSASDQYSVKTICQMTGLNEHTLRAWERRYQVVSPSRLDNGRRVYSLGDLEKLKLVTLLVHKGFLIGNIAQMPLPDLQTLINNASSLLLVDDGKAARREEVLATLKRSIEGYELLKVHSLLQQARVEYGIRDFLLEIVVPFILHIGEAVERGELGIGQEHAWSAIVRSELMQILYLLTQSHSLIRQKESVRTFAIATNEGNQHEFGALISAGLCAYHGYSTFYFGPNMPAYALADASHAVGANCIILGLPTVKTPDFARLDLYSRELREKMPVVCELWVGGFASDSMLAENSLRVLPSLIDLDHILETIKKL